MPACGVAAATSAFLFGRRPDAGHREELLNWLLRREEEASVAYREIAVTVRPRQTKALMRPAGLRGGRLPR